MGRRKLPRSPHEDTGRPAKPTKTLYCRRFSVCRPDESSVPPRALEQPVRRRRDLPRSRPRAVRIGPGRRPGPSRTAPERSERSRERPEAGQEAPRPPQSRPRAAKTGPRARHNGFRGAHGGGGRASRALFRRPLRNLAPRGDVWGVLKMELRMGAHDSSSYCRPLFGLGTPARTGSLDGDVLFLVRRRTTGQ